MRTHFFQLHCGGSKVANHSDYIPNSIGRRGRKPQRSTPSGGHTLGLADGHDDNLPCLARDRRRGPLQDYVPNSFLACRCAWMYARESTQLKCDHGEFTQPLGVGRASLM